MYTQKFLSLFSLQVLANILVGKPHCDIVHKIYGRFAICQLHCGTLRKIYGRFANTLWHFTQNIPYGRFAILLFFAWRVSYTSLFILSFSGLRWTKESNNSRPLPSHLPQIKKNLFFCWLLLVSLPSLSVCLILLVSPHSKFPAAAAGGNSKEMRKVMMEGRKFLINESDVPLLLYFSSFAA